MSRSKHRLILLIFFLHVHGDLGVYLSLCFDFFFEQGYLSSSQAMKIPSYQIISSFVIETFDEDAVQTLSLILFFFFKRKKAKTLSLHH